MEFDRVAGVKTLLKAAGGKIESAKKLHKLAYLCQAKGEDLSQDFIFHYYGVYSPSLSNDLDFANFVGAVNVKEKGNSTSTVLLDATKVSVPNTPGFKLVTLLKDKEPRLLEVLSTIVYLYKTGLRGSNLSARLIALKGQHKQFFSEGKQLAEDHFGITY